MYSVGIVGLGSCLPDKIVTNHDLSKIVDTSDEWIVDRTGIKERRIADKAIATSDLSTKAAIRALEDGNTNPEDIDLIILASVTPDYSFPSTASIVQKNIGALNAAAFDMNVGCSGFVYALATGANFIKTGIYKNVLVIGGETLSKIVNWEDRNTCVLFGDGAGACLLERCEDGYGLLYCELGSDGRGGDLLVMPGGGSRNPASLETLEEKLHVIQMDGREVFKFAVRIMEKATVDALEKADLDLDDLDFLVPHQANMRIIQAAKKKLKLEDGKIYTNLDKYGNMSSASIPVALDEAYRKNLLNKGDNIALTAFGAGLTWASVIIKWSKGESNV